MSFSALGGWSYIWTAFSLWVVGVVLVLAGWSRGRSLDSDPGSADPPRAPCPSRGVTALADVTNSYAFFAAARDAFNAAMRSCVAWTSTRGATSMIFPSTFASIIAIRASR